MLLFVKFTRERYNSGAFNAIDKPIERYDMMIFKKNFVSAILAFVMIITCVAPMTALASQVKNDGFENGNGLDLNKIGSYVSGVSNLDGGVSEIISYDLENNKAWVVNGATGMLDILELKGVTCGTSDTITAVSLDIKSLAYEEKPEFVYGDMTSVSICSKLGLVAVALQADAYDANGYVAILSTDGKLMTMIEAGVQPDMVTFTPDGSKILVANEGEPREGYGEGVVDPAGSVTVVRVNAEDPALSTHQNIGFEAFDKKRDELVAAGVMMVKGNAPSADLEPEYIACTDNTAYISLQEANAVAVLDLKTEAYVGVYALGYQNLGLEENALDLVEDGAYISNTYPEAVAAYMPDGISVYEVDGTSYLLTANEGDAREWGSDENEYCNEIKESLIASDGTKAKKVRVIDPESTDGLPEDKHVLFSSRSFSVFRVDEDGLTRVFDSGKAFEEKTATYIPEYFNCSNDDNELDSRSPKKGIEPESVTVGTVDDHTYAFVALERISGIMVYDITDPANATYVNYINTRDFSENPEDADPKENPDFYLTGDVAPEGMYLINTADTMVLLVAFEVSGTVGAYSVGGDAAHNFENNVCTKCGEIIADGTTGDDTTGDDTIGAPADDDTDVPADDTDVTPNVEHTSPATGDPVFVIVVTMMVALGFLLIVKRIHCRD